jgi:hypothetical protein
MGRRRRFIAAITANGGGRYDLARCVRGGRTVGGRRVGGCRSTWWYPRSRGAPPPRRDTTSPTRSPTTSCDHTELQQGSHHHKSISTMSPVRASLSAVRILSVTVRGTHWVYLAARVSRRSPGWSFRTRWREHAQDLWRRQPWWNLSRYSSRALARSIWTLPSRVECSLRGEPAVGVASPSQIRNSPSTSRRPWMCTVPLMTCTVGRHEHAAHGEALTRHA